MKRQRIISTYLQISQNLTLILNKIYFFTTKIQKLLRSLFTARGTGDLSGCGPPSDASRVAFYGTLWKKTTVPPPTLVVALVTKSCPTLCNPMDYSPLGYSVHGILQSRILECVAMPFSRGSSGPRDQTWVSCIVGRVFTVSAIEKSLAPTLLHPSFKGRTNRKPMALVKRAVLTCHHYQTSFL